MSDSESGEVALPLRWQIPGTRIAIARVEQGPARSSYLFTAGTVRRAARFYSMVKQLPYRTDDARVSPGLIDVYIGATKISKTQAADTSSPRGTLTMFLDKCNELFQQIKTERYFDRSNPEFHAIAQQILSCMDTSQLPEYAREYFDAEAAVSLKEILDRIRLPPSEQIPGSESIDTAAGSDPLVRWQVPGTQIVITRMMEGPRKGEFLFAADTVSSAPALYQKLREQPYRTEGPAVSEGLYEWWLSSPGNPLVASWVDRLPAWFQDRRFGMAIWQGLGLLLATPLGIAAMVLAYRLARSSGERARGKSVWRYWLSLGYLVVMLLVPIAFKHFAWDYLTLRGTVVYVINFCADVMFLLGTLALIVGVSSRTAESIIALPHISPRGLDANLVRIICRVLGIGAAVVVLLEGGRYLGFPLTTLIASAGIGGLAIALSAQGLIKGLFGTVTILLDKPYLVGDRIVAKGHDGFVEEIGLRSTKLRSLTGHLICLPNDQMADSEIENVGKRTHIHRAADLHIPIDTPRQKVEQAVACIRALLEDHEGMDPDFPPRVYFNEFNPDSFNVRIYYWYTPPDRWDYYAFCEKVNLAIFRAFEDHGIQFSLPFRHSYWKQDDQQGPLEVTLVKEDGKVTDK